MNITSAQLNALLECERMLEQIQRGVFAEQNALNRLRDGVIDLRERLETPTGNTLGIIAKRLIPSISLIDIAPTLSVPFTIMQGECALQCRVNNKIVRFLRDNGLLRLQTFNSDCTHVETNIIWPNLPGCTAEMTLQYVSRCHIVLDGRDPHFSPCYYLKETESSKISLLKSLNNQFLWSFHDKVSQITKWSPFNLSTQPSIRCHKEASEAISLIRPSLTDNGNKYFKDFDVYGIDINSSGEVPFTVFMEPKSFPSRIDDRIRVSKFMWAVTVIANDGICGNHAEIIIEGINDKAGTLVVDVGDNNGGPKAFIPTEKIPVGESFIWKSHFSPRIESIKITPEELTYQERTQVWMVSSQKVHEMLQAIKEECLVDWDNRDQGGYLRNKFSPFGKSSIFAAGGHNCFTWIVEKLKMLGIFLGEIPGEEIACLVKRVTKLDSEHKKLPVAPWL